MKNVMMKSMVCLAVLWGIGCMVHADITTGLYGHWALDGDWTDSSGNGRNLTTIGAGGAPVSSSNGHLGTSYLFDNSVATKAQCLFPGAINIPASGGITFTAWINPSYLQNEGNGYSTTSPHVISRFYNSAAGSSDLRFEIRNAKLEAYYPFPSAHNATAFVIPTNQWVFVAFTQSGTNLSIYMNNQKQSFTVANGINMDRMILGALEAGTARGLNGLLDEVRVYNRALSDSEIGEVYAYVPEPATVVLLGIGGLTVCMKKKRYV